MEVSKILKNIRKKKNLTQRELGNILGISNQMVSKIENSIAIPSKILTKKIIDLFPDEFYPFIEKKYSKINIKEFEKEIMETYELLREENNPYTAIASFRRNLIKLNQEISETSININTLQGNDNFKYTIPKIKRPIKTTIKYLESITNQLKEIIDDDYLKIEDGEENGFK